MFRINWRWVMLLVLLLVAILLMGRPGPTVLPDDVHVAAVYRNTAMEAGKQPLLVVEVDYRGASPLFSRNRLANIYVFDGNHPLNPLGNQGEDVLVANHGETYEPAVATARKMGFLPADYPQGLSEGGGVLYTGSSFPKSFSFLASGSDSKELLVVFVYSEKKLWKNIVWTRTLVVPLR